ncbi:MAG: antibiotic biosynthesis monooxygenase [Bacteroidetes bacterium]|nr:antibiotic biosynthesis monooxygenase [Bacteroidota bacterium]
MKINRTTFYYLLLILVMQSFFSCSKKTMVKMESQQMVRLAKLVIDSTQLDAYNALLKEEIEASVRLEPGVLTLYAVSEKNLPNHITILEIYASTDAYKAHLLTPHFLKYKNGTKDMVKSLELVETVPLVPSMKIKG